MTQTNRFDEMLVEDVDEVRRNPSATGPMTTRAVQLDPAHVLLRGLMISHVQGGGRRPVNCRWCGQPIAADRPHWQECATRAVHLAAQREALK